MVRPGDREGDTGGGDLRREAMADALLGTGKPASGQSYTYTCVSIVYYMAFGMENKGFFERPAGEGAADSSAADLN